MGAVLDPVVAVLAPRPAPVDQPVVDVGVGPVGSSVSSVPCTVIIGLPILPVSCTERTASFTGLGRAA